MNRVKNNKNGRIKVLEPPCTVKTDAEALALTLAIKNPLPGK